MLGCITFPALSRAQHAPPAASASQALTFSIPAQALPSAINAFIRITGWQISYSSELARGKSSTAVSGSMTPAQALQQLVAGTGLGVQIGASGSAALVNPASAAALARDGSIVLDTIDVQSSGDGTVGLVATRTTAGTKTNTPLIEVPQTINVVTREQMDIQAAQTVMSAVRYVPGVNVETIGAASMGEDRYIYSRGFILQQYLDGLRTGGNITGTYTSVNPWLLERVDVLKGPSSMLYGSNTPGGLLDMVSKRPTETPIHEIQLQTGSYGRIQGAFDIGGPIDPKGEWLYRLTGIGFTAGTQFGEDTKDQQVAIAPAVTWRPNEDTKLTILGKYQYTPNITGYQFLPAQGTALPNPNGPISATLWTGDPSVNDSWFRQSSVGYEFEHSINDVWTVRQNLRYENDESQQIFVYAFGLSPSDPTMQTANRYSTSRFSTFNRIDVDNVAEAKFRTGDLEHTVLVGFDYQYNTTQQSGGAGSATPLNLYSPIYRGASYPKVTVDSDQSQWQAGLYAQDQIKLHDRWVLTAGGRYDWSGADTTNLMTNVTTDQGDDAFTGRIGLTYLSEIGLAPYVSYSTSFEPVSGTDWNSNAFLPTTGEQYEAGIKYQPQGYNAFIQASVFNIVQQNVLTSDPYHPGYSIQTGEITTRGIELEGKATLANGLNLILSYAYLHAEVTKSNGDDLGKTPTNTPSNTASAWLTYTVQNGDLAGLTLGGGVRYVGETYGTTDNVWTIAGSPYSGTPSVVPAYTLVDAVVKYDFGLRHPGLKGLNLQVNATNLFNEDYVAGCTSAYSCYLGSARTVYATLNYKF